MVFLHHVKGSIEKLNSTPKWPVSRRRKGKEITTDLRQVVESLQSITKKDMEDRHIIPCPWPEDVKDEETPYFYLTLRSIARFNLKPAEVIGSIMGLSEEMMKMLRILKLVLKVMP